MSCKINEDDDKNYGMNWKGECINCDNHQPTFFMVNLFLAMIFNAVVTFLYNHY